MDFKTWLNTKYSRLEVKFFTDTGKEIAFKYIPNFSDDCPDEWKKEDRFISDLTKYINKDQLEEFLDVVFADEYTIKKVKIKGEETLIVKFAPGEELRIVNKIDPDLTNGL